METGEISPDRSLSCKIYPLIRNPRPFASMTTESPLFITRLKDYTLESVPPYVVPYPSQQDLFFWCECSSENSIGHKKSRSGRRRRENVQKKLLKWINWSQQKTCHFWSSDAVKIKRSLLLFNAFTVSITTFNGESSS